MDLGITLGSVIVGFVVGLTGMGGGALMTPMLVLVFNISPLTAVSSDLVAAAVMKPVGGGVHMRRGTFQPQLAKWLILGSVPSAVLGVVLLRGLGEASAIQGLVKVALGAALLAVSIALMLRDLVLKQRASADRSMGSKPPVRPVPTLIVGAVGGLIVGATSVGSGSLMMVALLLLYPALRLGQLVGTDLVQAVPLVLAAGVAHIFFGDVSWSLTASILLGALPGIYVGARFSSRAPDQLIRPALIGVLSLSGMQLLGLTALISFPLALGLSLWVLVASLGKRPKVASGIVATARPSQAPVTHH